MNIRNTYTVSRLTIIALAVVAFITVALATSSMTAAQDNLTISIPDLAINTGIKQFPLNGVSWTIHPWEQGIGHLQGTGWFNQQGNIALAAHSTMPDFSPGIFSRLHEVSIGSEITIRTGGEERIYRVSATTNVAIDDLTVLYPTNSERLTLITCDAASYNPQHQYYQRRIVVIADRVH